MYSIRKNKKEMLDGLTDVYTSKCLGRNTVSFQLNNGDRGVKYHDTVVFLETTNGTILNSGGFRTRTTLNRINDALKAGMVYSEKGLWYLSYNKKTYVFTDGMRLEYGKVYGEDKTQVNKVKKLRKQIAKYCKTIKTMDELPVPSAGDCFLCRITEDGKVLGDTSGCSHLISHLDEQYVHGLLLVNAIKARNHQDTSFVWRHKDLVAQAVRIYFCKNLGLSY